MAMEFELFKYFGLNEARNDSYKDANGKGIFQRYTEAIGRDIDFFLDKIENLLINHSPFSSSPYILKLIGENNGLPYDKIYKGENISIIKRLVNYSKSIVESRGSKLGAEWQIYYIFASNVTVNIVNNVREDRFDSSLTFDSSIRNFDTSNKRGSIDFFFTSSYVLGDDEKATLKLIQEYNTPFDCTSRAFLNNIEI